MGLIAAGFLAALAGAAVAAVAVRDAVYWEKPLPGVELSQVDLGRTVQVVVAERTYDVRPGEALMVDDAATQAALVKAGHDSFLRRVRQLIDPSPPVLDVDPVLVPRPGAERIAERLSRALPKPRRAQVVSRGGSFSVLPSQPGDAVDAAVAARRARARGPHRCADALARTDPRRAHADDPRCRRGSSPKR